MAVLSTKPQGIQIVSGSTGAAGIALNENFSWLDAFAGGVVDITATPPASPADGDLYIVSTSPTGTWASDGAIANQLALYSELDWYYITPPASGTNSTGGGLTLYVQSRSSLYTWNGTSWVPTIRHGVQLHPVNVEYATAAASTVNNHDVLLFESSLGSSSSSAGILTQNAVWKAYIPRNYGSNGITIEVLWTANTTTGSVVWTGSVESLSVGNGIGSDSFGTSVNSDVVSAPTTARQIRKSTIVLSDGVETDNLSAGDLIRIKIERDILDAGDTMTAADAEFISAVAYETGTI